jgi:hypothetical protein
VVFYNLPKTADDASIKTAIVELTEAFSETLRYSLKEWLAEISEHIWPIRKNKP